MKKFLVIAFTAITIFCLTACGGSDNPDSRPSPDDAYVPDPSLVYTAEFLVSCQQTDDAYDDFYYNSDFHCAIPGLKQKFIPQGVAYDEFTSSTFLTGYFDGGENSVIFVMDKNGNFVKEIILSFENKAYTGHSGGIAVSEKHVYVSNGKKLYHLSKQQILDGAAHQELSFDGFVKVDVNASYVSYSDGHLYVGEFEYAKNDYNTDPSHRVTLASGKTNTALTLELELNENTVYGFENAVSSGDTVAYTRAFSHTERIQGFDFSKDSDLVVLSQSYGRKNDSRLYFHKPSKSDEAKITVGGAEIPLVVLSEDTLEKTVVCPPMTEDIDISGGKVYVCFESAAYKYYEGANAFNKAKNPIDSIFVYTI